MDRNMQIFYDGECPFCKKYVQYQNISRHFDTVSMVNLRNLKAEHRALLESYNANINKGIIVIYNENNKQRFLQGRMAVAFLSQYDEHNWFMRIIHKTFKLPVASNLLYGVVFILRKVTLFLMGRKIRIH